MATGRHYLEAEIQLLQHQTQSYLREIRELIEKRSALKTAKVISYFTTSFSLPHNLEQDSLCLASYHIYNIGNEPLLNPSICIRLPEQSPISFSGRYVYEHLTPNAKRPNEWQRILNESNKHEYWLKPLSQSVIEPNEMISFSNFHIKWSPNESFKGSITGSTYCDQFQEGVAAINPIHLTIYSTEQEESS